MSSINYYLLREQYYLTKISKCSLCRNILKKKYYVTQYEVILVTINMKKEYMEYIYP